MGKEFIVSMVIHGLVIILSLMSFKTVTIKAQMGSQSPISAQAIVPVRASIVNDRDVRVAIERQKQEELRQQIADNKLKVENLAAQNKALQLKKELEVIKKQKALEEVALKKAQQEKMRVQQESKKNLEKIASEQKKAKEKLAQEIAAGKLAAEKLAKEQQLAAERAAAEQQQAFVAGEVGKFQNSVINKIIENRNNLSAFSSDLNCDIRTKITADGDLISAVIERSSGNPEYDDLQLKALYKAAPFEMPEDQTVVSQLQDLILNLRNDDGDHVSEIS